MTQLCATGREVPLCHLRWWWINMILQWGCLYTAEGFLDVWCKSPRLWAKEPSWHSAMFLWLREPSCWGTADTCASVCVCVDWEQLWQSRWKMSSDTAKVWLWDVNTLPAGFLWCHTEVDVDLSVIFLDRQMLIIKNRIQEHLPLVQTTTKAVKGTLTWQLTTLATTLTLMCT